MRKYFMKNHNLIIGKTKFLLHKKICKIANWFTDKLTCKKVSRNESHTPKIFVSRWHKRWGNFLLV